MFTYKVGSKSEDIVNKLQISPLLPPCFLRNSHIQTCIGYSYKPAKLNITREIFTLKNNSNISLDWVGQSSNCENIAIINHGITGSSRERCVREISLYLSKNKFLCMIMNKRGNGDYKVNHHQIPIESDPSDFIEIINEIKSRYPNSKVHSVGFSMGATIPLGYLNYCKNNNIEPLLSSICTISLPMIPVQKLCHGLKFPYKNFILKEAKNIMNYQTHIHPKINRKSLLGHTTLHTFFEEYYTTLHNIDKNKLWQTNNDLFDNFKYFNVPILCIISKDDPFFSVTDEHKIFESHDSAILLQTDYGGHNGFIQNWKGERWFNSVVLQFIKSLCTN